MSQNLLYRYLQFKQYHDRPILTDQNVHNNRPAIIILDKTIKEEYLIDVAIVNGHSLHSTISEKG
jgi:hypothetical protein